MNVLYVCTANICRSPSAAALLRDANLPGIEARSAGTVAADGMPGCTVAPLLNGRSDQHRSQRLTAELLAWADLVLTAAREHQAAVVALDPKVRSRTFTIRQAGRLAQWLLDAGMVEAAKLRVADPVGWADGFEEDDPRVLVSPLHSDDAARWLVEELDAARGMAPAPVPQEPTRRRFGRRQEELQNPDDVPDPHVLGTSWHEPAAEQVGASTAELVALLRAIDG